MDIFVKLPLNQLRIENKTMIIEITRIYQEDLFRINQWFKKTKDLTLGSIQNKTMIWENYMDLREGVNKKTKILGDMSPKLWPPPTSTSKWDKSRLFFSLFLLIFFRTCTQTWVTLQENGFNKKCAIGAATKKVLLLMAGPIRPNPPPPLLTARPLKE